jgi:hypothetical protein
MYLIRTSWIKFIFWPLWPVAAVYWAAAAHRGQPADWRRFDLWVWRGWWTAVGVAFLVGAISAAIH